MSILPTAVLLLAWLATDPGLAPDPFHPAGGRSGELVMEPSTELRPVQVDELFRSGPSRAVIGKAALLPLEGPAWLERNVPVVWEMWLPKEWRPERLEVEYDVTSPSGARNRLGIGGRSDSHVELRLVASPPEVVAETDDAVLVRGSLTLELSLESLQVAGTYEGNLSVTVNRR